jgi:hypothetical protein
MFLKLCKQTCGWVAAAFLPFSMQQLSSQVPQTLTADVLYTAVVRLLQVKAASCLTLGQFLCD